MTLYLIKSCITYKYFTLCVVAVERYPVSTPEKVILINRRRFDDEQLSRKMATEIYPSKYPRTLSTLVKGFYRNDTNDVKTNKYQRQLKGIITRGHMSQASQSKALRCFIYDSGREAIVLIIN